MQRFFLHLQFMLTKRLVENLDDRKFWEIIFEPSTAFARHSTALSNLVHLFVRL